ncbi:hypothetical protein [Streptomyces sp. NPDC045470]|uniref:hypothetical protein n=1 Tax=Streptomyces sp. NPDC045470 TaxID=3155469 RepID=UPI0033EBD32F
MTSPLTALSWNIEKGIKGQQAAAWVRAQQPDIFFQQELPPDQLTAQAERLGMDGYIAPCHPGRDDDLRDRHRNAIFLKRGGPLAFDEEFRQTWMPWSIAANLTVRLRDADGTLSPRRISCVSGQACYWNAGHRRDEARWCSTLAKPGWLAVHFWDWNSYRVGDGPQNWSQYTDHAYVAMRTYDHGGRRYSDDRPDREMLGAGYVEMACYAANRLQQLNATKAASGYRRRPGRPPGRRYCIDRGYLSAELTPALTGFEVCDTDGLRQISGHLPLRATFDTAVLRTVLHRDAAACPPHQNRHPQAPACQEGTLTA